MHKDYGLFHNKMKRTYQIINLRSGLVKHELTSSDKAKTYLIIVNTPLHRFPLFGSRYVNRS